MMKKRNESTIHVTRYLPLLLAVTGAGVLMPEAVHAQCTGTWSQVASSGPSARYVANLADDSGRSKMVLFGGFNSALGGYLADTWEWSGGEWSHRAATGPSARYFAGFAFDAQRGVSVGFGGAGDGTFGDTWEWDGAQWIDRGVVGPPARINAAMVYDAARRVCVLFGGATTNRTLLGDTWEWNGVTWSLRSTTGPAPRWTHAMAYDSVRGVTVLFGGGTTLASDNNSDTWEWDGSTWTQRLVPSPPARHNHAMAFDRTLGKTVLFGGHLGAFPNGATFGDTWTYDGSSWVEVTPGTSPSSRADNCSIAYSEVQRATMLFGGLRSGPTFLADTWLLSTLPVVVSRPESRTVCRSGAVSFSIAAAGAGPFTYQWRKGSTPLDALANPSAATASLAIASVGLADAGSYDCIVTNSCGSVTSDPATLTIQPCGGCSLADLAGGGPDGLSFDGIVDGSDFIAFINSFSTGDPAIDPLADVAGGGDDGLSPDGIVDGNDFVAFINAFSAGC